MPDDHPDKPLEIGLERSYDEYITKLCDIFDEIKRVLRPEGTCWVVLADTYSGSGGRQKRAKMPNKKSQVFGMSQPAVPTTDIPRRSLCLIPFRFAIEMVRRGWIARNVIVWRKRNTTPESMKNRFTIDYELLFFFSKSERYYFKQQFEPTVDRKTREGGQLLRNRRCVWDIPTAGFAGNHFAVYPEALVEIPIKAGSPPEGIVLDPFAGTGTTAAVAERLGRRWICIELNQAYVEIAQQRLASLQAV